jgi:hypothetical protein
MTLPAIVPTGYAGTVADFLHVKADRSGAVRCNSVTLSIPAGTLSTATIGLIPFTVGAKLASSEIYVDALDTSSSVSMKVGVLYNTNTANNTTIYYSSTTLPQAGGFIPTASKNNAGVGYITLDSGWFVVQFTGAATNATGNLKAVLNVAYDTSGITN